ncbi:MAG: hypothetical protein QXP03_03780 [Desulfurococcaceae archaeon]
MACFITPLLAGLVVGLLNRVRGSSSDLKLNVLFYMLLGGALVLAAEHAWHGELVPYPPFLTAMQSPEDLPVVLNEIGVVGSSMTLAVTTLWLGILGISRKMKTRTIPPTRIVTTLEVK